MRKLAREVARNQSYKKRGTTDMFYYFFDKNWRQKGHPASNRMNPTKKRRIGRRKK